MTPRERELFQLLALGKSNKEIARDLSMSLGTAELARLAIREGLLGA